MLNIDNLFIFSSELEKRMPKIVELAPQAEIDAWVHRIMGYILEGWIKDPTSPFRYIDEFNKLKYDDETEKPH